MKIWICGSSPQSGSQNAWMRIKNINSTSHLSNFWNFFSVIQIISCQARMVTMDKTWLYHYDPETKLQSMEWWHSGSPCPKKITSAKIRWKSSHLDFLGLRWHSPHWLSSKGSNYQCRVLFIFAGATEGHFEGKTPREGHQWCLVLARQCPGSPDTCNREETGLLGLPVFWSSTLFSGSGPVGLPPVPWTEKKNNWKASIFRPTRRSLLPRIPGWTDNFLNCFWVACRI